MRDGEKKRKKSKESPERRIDSLDDSADVWM